MSKTRIFTTRKLEKITKEFISENEEFNNEYLGDWTSTLFYVSHKKCWLLINKMTKYLLILPNIKKTDLKNISSIFKENLFAQLTFDGIETRYELVEKIIGEIKLQETNNDRSTNGSLNNCLLFLKDWKYEFGDYENMNFRDLNGRLNSSPNKMLNWKYPKEKMNEMINNYEKKSFLEKNRIVL
ncbi:DUF6933 domain-containing protein [Tenacibaculum haliotis]|uniref:DUF6933 domain-containing protein n=1 Tax=Tenacibaculum haliotis TaxID=1888914 RepID=UPI0021AF83C4|nr:hypothetical protein [Tenacibaculum haliotis]MCT4697555.1 hypothetical protein [Tenacibaculum haliotis]